MNGTLTSTTPGVEPPADIKRLYELAAKFKTLELGSAESNAVGKEVSDIHLKNLWKIGLVGKTISPVVTINSLGNFRPFTVATYDYYWALPFRPQQWYFKQ